MELEERELGTKLSWRPGNLETKEFRTQGAEESVDGRPSVLGADEPRVGHQALAR